MKTTPATAVNIAKAIQAEVIRSRCSRWYVAQIDMHGEVIKGTQTDVTELVLDTSGDERAENTTKQACVAEDLMANMTEEKRVNHTYWFHSA